MIDYQDKWLKTGISNDFIFYYVMRDNLDICLELLQAIFPGLGITAVRSVETQRVIEEDHSVHGVRLDVYTEDTDERAYDVEMQAVKKGDIMKRSRFNQSMMDMHQLSKSADYSELKRSFVIFICNFDLFGKGRYIYTFENICTEDTDIRLKDETVKVFINARGKIGPISDKLKNFLLMVSKNDATDEFTRKIKTAVDYLHMNREMRNAYMTLEMKIAEETKEARAIGMAEGRAEGLAEGMAEGRSDMLKIISHMVTDGLQDEIPRLTTDNEFLEEMTKKYIG